MSLKFSARVAICGKDLVQCVLAVRIGLGRTFAMSANCGTTAWATLFTVKPVAIVCQERLQHMNVRMGAKQATLSKVESQHLTYLLIC